MQKSAAPEERWSHKTAKQHFQVQAWYGKHNTVGDGSGWQQRWNLGSLTRDKSASLQLLVCSE
jgi:hypothetical protein